MHATHRFNINEVNMRSHSTTPLSLNCIRKAERSSENRKRLIILIKTELFSLHSKSRCVNIHELLSFTAFFYTKCFVISFRILKPQVDLYACQISIFSLLHACMILQSFSDLVENISCCVLFCSTSLNFALVFPRISSGVSRKESMGKYKSLQCR